MSDCTEGILLKRGDAASPEVFTTLGSVVNITGPNRTMSVIDVSTITDAFKRKKGGMKDSGQVSFDILYSYNDATHVTLLADYEARTLRNFQLVIVDASPDVTYDFAALVTEFNETYQQDDVVRATVTLDIDAGITES